MTEIERGQDRETGLWFGDGARNRRLGIYAAYHFVPFFLWRGRRLGRINEMIDSILSVQSTEGLFADSIGGGAREDLDAIDLLVKLSGLSQHRAGEVRRCLRRAFDRILQLQSEEGGFPNYLRTGWVPSWKRQLVNRLGLARVLNRWRPAPTEVSYYSGWTAVSALRGELDLWGKWFRYLALMLIASRPPELEPPQANIRYHRLPALDWHTPDPTPPPGQSRTPGNPGSHS